MHDIAQSCDTIRIATKNKTKQTRHHGNKALYTHKSNFAEAS